jgi:hypothetical protein
VVQALSPGPGTHHRDSAVVRAGFAQ